MLANRFTPTYRAGGIAVERGRVLIHRGIDDPFWSLPGGRVEADESARDTLPREMREELDAVVRVGRLRFVMDNRFTYRGTHYQEVGLYFAMRFPRASSILRETGSFFGVERTVHLEFAWVPLDALARYDARPSAIFEALLRPRRGTVYLYQNDIGRYPEDA